MLNIEGILFKQHLGKNIHPKMKVKYDKNLNLLKKDKKKHDNVLFLILNRN